VWVIVLNLAALGQSSCTCRYFVKNRTCKHVLGMQIPLKLVKVPDEAKHIPLGQKRKRDGPEKEKRALMIQ